MPSWPTARHGRCRRSWRGAGSCWRSSKRCETCRDSATGSERGRASSCHFEGRIRSKRRGGAPMADDAKPPTGPDLERGVEWRELADGQPLVGHAGGEAVMLVRRGEDAFAIGATCTHYGGPLGKGLV